MGMLNQTEDLASIKLATPTYPLSPPHQDDWALAEEKGDYTELPYDGGILQGIPASGYQWVSPAIPILGDREAGQLWWNGGEGTSLIFWWLKT